MANHTNTPVVTTRYLRFPQKGLDAGEVIHVIDLCQWESYVATRLGNMWIATSDLSYFAPEHTN